MTASEEHHGQDNQPAPVLLGARRHVVEVEDGKDAKSVGSTAADDSAAHTAEVEVEVEVEAEGHHDGEEEGREEALLAARRRAADDECFWAAAQQALRERERREKVGAFLKAHGFTDVNTRKGWMFSGSYPLHRAAELADAEMVRLLLESQANRKQRDTSGRTARQVAKHLNSQGSHAEVIKALARPRPVRPPPPKANPSVKEEGSSKPNLSLAIHSVAGSLVAGATDPAARRLPARDACVQCDLGDPANSAELSPEGL